VGKMEENFLHKNLNCISEYNQDLADRIAGLESLSNEYSLESSAVRNQPVLYINGLPANNIENPIKEAKNIFDFELQNNNPNNIYIVVGFEIGHLFNYFTENCKGTVIVYDPCIDTLRIAFELGDYSYSLRKNNVFVANNAFDLESVFIKKFKKNNLTKVYVFVNDFYKQAYVEYLEKLNIQIKNLYYPCKKTKINIGAGVWSVKDWGTLDCYLEADHFVDLRRMDKLSIEDNFLEKVFSSHCIEHIENSHLEHLLKELYRCIKPGGILRIGCPDAEKAFEAYENNDESWFLAWLKPSHIGEMLLNVFVSYDCLAGGPKMPEEIIKEKYNSMSKEDFIEWCVSLKDKTRPYIAHTNGYTFVKLKRMLEEAGFKDVEKSSYRKSKDKELQGPEFDNYEHLSLFVECRK